MQFFELSTCFFLLPGLLRIELCASEPLVDLELIKCSKKRL